MSELIVVGGGLAGCEAAWQAAEAGVPVRLYEMRPGKMTPAHVSDRLAELVCSNSLGSDLPHKAPGLLKAELRGLGSMVLDCAEQTAVPAGSSLAVDRERFAELVTQRIQSHPLIELVHEEVTAVPDTPASSPAAPSPPTPWPRKIGALSGQEHLYFYDALSPIVNYESINMTSPSANRATTTANRPKATTQLPADPRRVRHAFIGNCWPPRRST
jgi:methylenetetrahydrofolate--tRNA-(uracil-5-)-methyltransferase